MSTLASQTSCNIFQRCQKKRMTFSSTVIMTASFILRHNSPGSKELVGSILVATMQDGYQKGVQT